MSALRHAAAVRKQQRSSREHCQVAAQFERRRTHEPHVDVRQRSAGDGRMVVDVDRLADAAVHQLGVAQAERWALRGHGREQMDKHAV